MCLVVYSVQPIYGINRAFLWVFIKPFRKQGCYKAISISNQGRKGNLLADHT